MIGRLRGVLLEKQAPNVLLDVQGVGYELQAPMSTFYTLPETGSEVSLFIHHVVREDAQLLFAFSAERERRLFRTLIKVNGVGPRMALAILSGIEADHFVACVHHNDTAALVKIPGVGKKTAERLLVEMRDRLADWDTSGLPNAHAGVGEAPGQSHMMDEAEGALLALGYKPQEASKAIAAAARVSCNSSEELIRRALQGMVKA